VVENQKSHQKQVKINEKNVLTLSLKLAKTIK
jgi:hypothetical protein